MWGNWRIGIDANTSEMSKSQKSSKKWLKDQQTTFHFHEMRKVAHFDYQAKWNEWYGTYVEKYHKTT